MAGTGPSARFSSSARSSRRGPVTWPPGLTASESIDVLARLRTRSGCVALDPAAARDRSFPVGSTAEPSSLQLHRQYFVLRAGRKSVLVREPLFRSPERSFMTIIAVRRPPQGRIRNHVDRPLPLSRSREGEGGRTTKARSSCPSCKHPSDPPSVVSSRLMRRSMRHGSSSACRSRFCASPSSVHTSTSA